MDTLFRIATDSFDLAIEGSEEFVRREMKQFLPDAAADSGSAGTSGRPPADSLAGWYARTVPDGRAPTMQDAILIFGYYLKRKKDRHMFTPTEMKRSFTEVNRKIPKSLLQIMGTLKRDHELLWSPEDRRGRYALTPKGIKHVEKLLALKEGGKEEPKEAAEPDFTDIDKAPALRAGGPDGPRSSSEKWSLLFREPKGKGSE